VDLPSAADHSVIALAPNSHMDECFLFEMHSSWSPPLWTGGPDLLPLRTATQIFR